MEEKSGSTNGRGWKENFRAMAFLESGLKTKKV